MNVPDNDMSIVHEMPYNKILENQDANRKELTDRTQKQQSFSKIVFDDLSDLDSRDKQSILKEQNDQKVPAKFK